VLELPPLGLGACVGEGVTAPVRRIMQAQPAAECHLCTELLRHGHKNGCRFTPARAAHTDHHDAGHCDALRMTRACLSRC
jgi:hypothetical protein